MIKKIIGISTLLAITPAYAVTMQTPIGGSGLGLMRTAEIMDSGEFAFSLGGNMAEYSASGAAPETTSSTRAPALSLGMGGVSEVHFTGPYLSTTPDAGWGVEGWMDPQMILKLGSPRPKHEGFASAVTVYGSIGKGDENKAAVSGEPTLGAELNFSNWFDNGALHFNLGYEESDTTVRNKAPINTIKYTAAIGAEKALSNTTTIFVQSTADMDIDANDDKNLIFAAGFQYTPSKNFGLQLGYGQGFPKNRSEPDSIFFLGLTFSLNGQRKQRYSSIQNNDALIAVKSQNEELSNHVTHLNNKVDELETRIAGIESAPAPEEPMVTADEPATTLPRVEVVNASRKPEVLNQLKHLGANVVNTRKTENTSEKRTWIRYREGFGKEAVSLGKKIDGTQIVVKRHLEDGVDIQIVIGNE